MRRANALRRAIRRILREEQNARPKCALVSTVGVDEDGREYIHFSCLNHDASWRYYVHVYIDTELAKATDSGSELHSRCPLGDQKGLQLWEGLTEEVSKEDSSAQASLDELVPSEEEC